MYWRLLCTLTILTCLLANCHRKAMNTILTFRYSLSGMFSWLCVVTEIQQFCLANSYEAVPHSWESNLCAITWLLSKASLLLEYWNGAIVLSCRNKKLKYVVDLCSEGYEIKTHENLVPYRRVVSACLILQARPFPSHTTKIIVLQTLMQSGPKSPDPSLRVDTVSWSCAKHTIVHRSCL